MRENAYDAHLDGLAERARVLARGGNFEEEQSADENDAGRHAHNDVCPPELREDVHAETAHGEYPELAHREEALAREVLGRVTEPDAIVYRLVLPASALNDPRRRPLALFASRAQGLTRLYTYKAPDDAIVAALEGLEASIVELRAAL